MKGEMSVREAGRKGGLSTKKSHDSTFFREIGKKGGMVTAQKILEEGISEEKHYVLSEAGKKGGKKTREKYGRKFYVNIGRKGGQSKRN